ALPADDEKDEILVGSIRHPPRRRRLDVDEPALGDLVILVVDRERRGPAVHEVELVLVVVVVRRSVVVRREDERIDTERRHAERQPDLAESVALSDLIPWTDLVAHARDPSAPAPRLPPDALRATSSCPR